MANLKIGIIGTGGIAHSHMNAYKRRDDIDIVALCDIVPGRAEAFAKEFGIENARIYMSHEEMLDKETELDGVSVCTYNRQHKAPTVCALEHGINVLL